MSSRKDDVKESDPGGKSRAEYMRERLAASRLKREKLMAAAAKPSKKVSAAALAALLHSSKSTGTPTTTNEAQTSKKSLSKAVELSPKRKAVATDVPLSKCDSTYAAAS